MSDKVGKYNIKAVSKVIGIQPGTLRAWERRYKIIAPKRNKAGHRLYTENQVEELKWLKSKLDEGFTIGQAVSLLENKAVQQYGIQSKEDRENPIDKIKSELIHQLLQFNETKAHEILNQAFCYYTPQKVMLDILGSVLLKIGDLWKKQRITSAHEHFVSSFIRSRIGMLFQALPFNQHLPKGVAVCAPKETHEFGLLMFTFFLRQKGYNILYLGESIAEKDIEAIIKEINPRFLFMSCTMDQYIERLLHLTIDLDQKYTNLHIGLGGQAVQHLLPAQKEKIQHCIIGSQQKEWESWLHKIEGK